MIEMLVTFLKDVLSIIYQPDYLEEHKKEKYIKTFVRILVDMGRLYDELSHFRNDLKQWEKQNFQAPLGFMFGYNNEKIRNCLKELINGFDKYHKLTYLLNMEFSKETIDSNFFLIKQGIFKVWDSIIACNKQKYYVENGEYDTIDLIHKENQKNIKVYIPNYSFLLTFNGNFDDMFINAAKSYTKGSYDTFKEKSDVNYYMSKNIAKIIELPRDKKEIHKIIQCTDKALLELNNAINDAKKVLDMFLGENKIDIINYL